MTNQNKYLLKKDDKINFYFLAADDQIIICHIRPDRNTEISLTTH